MQLYSQIAVELLHNKSFSIIHLERYGNRTRLVNSENQDRCVQCNITGLRRCLNVLCHVFQVTDHATTALLHYQLPQMPDVVVRSFMVSDRTGQLQGEQVFCINTPGL